jgi:hypothetical protein
MQYLFITALVKLIQTQTPQCISEVSKYLSRAGPIPFIVREVEAMGPGQDVSLMLEDYDPHSCKYELDLTIRSIAQQQALQQQQQQQQSQQQTLPGRRGLLSVALPRASFNSGADINVLVSPAGSAEVRARLVLSTSDRLSGTGIKSSTNVIPDALRGIVGPATVAVVEFWVDGSDGEVELEIRMEPGRHGIVLNGEPLDP